MKYGKVTTHLSVRERERTGQTNREKEREISSF